MLDEAKAWNWDEQGSGSGTAESELFHLEFTTVSTGREEPDVPHEDDKFSAAMSEISSIFFVKYKHIHHIYTQFDQTLLVKT